MHLTYHNALTGGRYPLLRCGCSVPTAEWLDSSAVGIVQLAHAAGESILSREGWRRGCSQMTLGRLYFIRHSVSSRRKRRQVLRKFYHCRSNVNFAGEYLYNRRKLLWRWWRKPGGRISALQCIKQCHCMDHYRSDSSMSFGMSSLTQCAAKLRLSMEYQHLTAFYLTVKSATILPTKLG